MGNSGAMSLYPQLFNVQRGAEEFVALFFEHAANDRALTKCRQPCELFGADVDVPPVQRFQERYRRSKHYASDPGPRNGALAHCTRLGGCIKRQPRPVDLRMRRGALVNRIHLAMPRRIMN